MKTLIIFLSIVFFSTTNVYSKEVNDCKNLKKFSLKLAMCKTKAASSSIKNKLSKKGEAKNESGKKSIFKKFGEAKTLSDLK